jgi:hypothetical protein
LIDAMATMAITRSFTMAFNAVSSATLQRN